MVNNLFKLSTSEPTPRAFGLAAGVETTVPFRSSLEKYN
jgi:hypothetical protein